MDAARASDGTGIACDRSSEGPPVILVTAPSAAEQEVEELEALIGRAGGLALVFGAPSDGVLALEAGVHGPSIMWLALYESPFVADDSRPFLSEHYVARLAELMSAGRRGDAVEYFMTRAAGLPAELVAELRGRGRAADRSWALGLLDRALATASFLGMAAVAEGIQALRAVEVGGSVPAEPAVEAIGAAAVARNVFRREGEYWTVCYDGSVVRLKDAKGLRHLARLLALPGREFHATDLEAADSQAAQAAPLGPRGRAGNGELAVRPDFGDAGELLDATAKAAYKARVEELRAELEEAEGFNDPARAAKARQELDFLVGELARAVGLGGRDRRAASHAERARLNATRAIRAA
ncbi:MAG TPA: hypothetical protein VFA46_03745, partial [Actinomycetes bacterium]|nr:hypothetical protein [Actinomycetes bacterium]